MYSYRRVFFLQCVESEKKRKTNALTSASTADMNASTSNATIVSLANASTANATAVNMNTATNAITSASTEAMNAASKSIVKIASLATATTVNMNTAYTNDVNADIANRTKVNANSAIAFAHANINRHQASHVSPSTSHLYHDNSSNRNLPSVSVYLEILVEKSGTSELEEKHDTSCSWA